MTPAPAWITAGLLPIAALAAAAALSAPFRFSRPVEAHAGWSRLELPDDVLDACRPNLPDLRLADSAGQEVPYAFEESLGGRTTRVELANVESTARRETTAVLDRGQRPPLARSVDLEIRESEFLKPVVLEASPDGQAYREIARGSLFAFPGGRATTLRFPPNDRRYWRLRFDDRNGDPIHPVAASIPAAGAATETRAISLARTPAGDTGSAMAARLPAANLAVTALRFSIQEPAYERFVRVFERVLFRDQVARRLVGGGTIRRAPDGPAEAEVPVCDLIGRNLEIEIENGDAPALHVNDLTALARPRRVLFFSRGGDLTLFYGSPTAPPPRYDLGAALSHGSPRSVADASAGRATEIGSPSPVSPPPPGAPVDASAWKGRQPIQTPSGSVAYLDLRQPLAGDLSALRIVDAENRQIPYIVEQAARRTTRPAALRVAQNGTRTVAEISGIDPREPPDAVTLYASAPEFFSREIQVLEQEHDARGAAGERFLGSARWERRPGEPARPVTVSLAPGRERTLRIEIENGDNAALRLDRAEIRIPYVRIDFVFTPGEPLFLLSENPLASAPRYDFAMIADRVLSSPARAAALGSSEPGPPRARVPKWFWVAVAAAAILVGLALVRTLSPEK